ncbi:MAG: PIN domain-containing protein [Woeseiaceae bacterium]|nr:PIN domain-containing protein [Woeseiaceae bacterium]
MILVDTSVWIEHLRRGEEALDRLLRKSRVLIHPFVVGEIACGNLKNRGTVLGYLQNLPQAALASQDEALEFIENRALMGRGIGFVDAHLLAATVLTPTAKLWTLDNSLAIVAAELRLAVDPGNLRA